jgi:hypothetical protein
MSEIAQFPDIPQLRQRQERGLFPVLESRAAPKKHLGSILVKCRNRSAKEELMDSGDSAYELDESEFVPPVADYTGPRLVRLPPSPFRSLGGYFNYAGWPEQQRFMELDDALRRQSREGTLTEATPIRAKWKGASPSGPLFPQQNDIRSA